MIDLEQFDTLTAALTYLKAAGFTHTLQCTGDKVQSLETGQLFVQDPFHLVACHRFRYGPQKDQRVVVYAIESANGTIKGILLDDCQSSGDPNLGHFLVKLKMRELPHASCFQLPQEHSSLPFTKRAS